MTTDIYEKLRAVPDEAKKPITAGRLKGMTDINPMWRIKRLTEVFGPCGIGWWYEITDKRIVPDEITKQVAAFLDINLFFRDPESGETSKPIPGTGGASFVAQERNGPYLSDECFKMALTDAISVAAKSIGLAADVYFEKDRDKYTDQNSAAEKPKEEEEEPLFCKDCSSRLVWTRTKDGQSMSPTDIRDLSYKRFGRILCPTCMVKASKDAETA